MVDCKEAPWQYFFILIAVIFYLIIDALSLVGPFTTMTIITLVIEFLLLIFLIYLLTKLFVMKDPSSVCCTTTLIVLYLIVNIVSIFGLFLSQDAIWHIILKAIASVANIAACIIYFVTKGKFEKVGPDNGTPPPSQPGYPPGDSQPGGYPPGGYPPGGYPPGDSQPGGYPPGGYYTHPPTGNDPPGDVAQTP
jgi:hypothetical protein